MFEKSLLAQNIQYLANKTGKKIGELEKSAGVSVGYTSRLLKSEEKAQLPVMDLALEAAKHSIHMEFYIFDLDNIGTKVLDLLEKKASEGIIVRLIVDSFGSPKVVRYMRKKKDSKIEFQPFLPVTFTSLANSNYRNHRKIVVIDDNIGYTGSQNLIDSSYLKPKNQRLGLHWKEVMVRLEGPIVSELQAVFITDWYSETDELLEVATTPYSDTTSGTFHAQVIPSGPSSTSTTTIS